MMPFLPSPRAARVAAALLALALLLLGAARGRAAPERSFDDYEEALEEALASEDEATRARAFDVLRDCADLRCVRLVLSAVRDLERDLRDVRRDQEKEQETFEDLFEDKLKADAWFERSSRSGRDLERYNRVVRKVATKMDASKLRQKSLENDVTRIRGQIDSAVMALGGVLGNLPVEARSEARAQVADAWRDGGEVDEALRWLDAVGGLEEQGAADEILAVVEDEDRDPALRAAALVTLAGRDDDRAPVRAKAWLEREDAPWDLHAGAIEALRRLHRRSSIEPLIAFLGREGIDRLREDARAALVSLTGEQHGPYQDPWKRWWEAEAPSFTMPAEPAVGPQQPEQDGAITFYGINTFSDRVVFILDVSGTMDQVPKTPPGGGAREPRIVTARKELAGAINNLDDGDHFNVILFNHQVIPWQRRMTEATTSSRRRAIEWAEEQPPVGATNIHDALEAAFRLATRTTGKPDVDTIFFMTDGSPTAGLVQDPARILDRVRDWNRAARMRIHVVGVDVGEEEDAFLAELAAIGEGRYVKR